MYAHIDSVPAGERVGSVVVICPASRNGRSGTTPAPICSMACWISSMESATCTVPGAYGGVTAHGTGPDSAQSTFTVPGSSSNRLETPHRARRQLGRRYQAAVQRGREHVRDHGRGRDPRPVRETYAADPVVGGVDADDLGRAAHLAHLATRAAAPAPR